MKRTKPLFLLACLLLGACQSNDTRVATAEATNTTPQALRESAQRLAQNAIIIDTHIDVPYRLFRAPDDVGRITTNGQFDYPRARRGGLNAPFMSIYIPAAVDNAGHAFDFAERSIEGMQQLAATHPDKFAIATCAADIEHHFETQLISLALGMENGGPISGELSNLSHFFERGIRYISLAHSQSNHISDSSYDDNERWQGLSEFGKTLIPAMNRQGVMIDVSHISDRAFWQVLALSQVPVIASHSSLRHFVPDFHRNMSDDMVKAMAAAGGVIQINFGSSFVTREAREYSNARSAAAKSYQLANHLDANDPAMRAFMRRYTQENPYPFAELDDVLDHIDRTVAIAGVDAVGIGSDYDGVGNTLPNGLKDVSSFPNLIAGLLRRGYSEADIRKILGLNTLRVWRAVEAYAAAQGTPTQCRSAT